VIWQAIELRRLRRERMGGAEARIQSESLSRDLR
jgi:hypothetical protein